MNEYKTQDTSWLQLESVIKCAKSIGYKFNGNSFYTIIERSDGYKKYFISFQDMQYIHNSGLYRVDFRGVKLPYCYLFRIGYKITVGSKIVEKSTLQWHKRKKQFIAQNNMVKFV